MVLVEFNRVHYNGEHLITFHIMERTQTCVDTSSFLLLFGKSNQVSPVIVLSTMFHLSPLPTSIKIISHEHEVIQHWSEIRSSRLSPETILFIITDSKTRYRLSWDHIIIISRRWLYNHFRVFSCWWHSIHIESHCFHAVSNVNLNQSWEDCLVSPHNRIKTKGLKRPCAPTHW